MRVASPGSLSRNVASIFQISKSSLLGSSLMFLVTRAIAVLEDAPDLAYAVLAGPKPLNEAYAEAQKRK
jgi:hypothetical protein